MRYSRLLRDDRWAAVQPGLARRHGAILGLVHSVDRADTPALERRTDRLGWLRAARDLWPGGSSSTSRPRRTLVHGDFHNGNLLVDDSGVRAVLNWELAHIGHPGEDLG